jgi:tyrosyl-tRNA synthetase
MYGKTMSIPDEALAEYCRLLMTPRGESSGALGGPAAEGLSPRDAKRALARGLVAWLHSEAAAEEAEAHFDRVFVQRGVPADVPEAGFACTDGMVHLPGLIAEEFGMSRSEARRVIDQGGVTLGEKPVAPGRHDVPCDQADGLILKVGRRRFRRLRAR